MAVTNVEAANRQLAWDVELDRVWSEGDLDAIEEYYHEDYVLHSPRGEDLDRDAFREYVFEIREAFPDFSVTADPDHTIADGDYVANQFIISGTHQGPYAGHDPTGESFAVGGIAMSRIVDGRFVEGWISSDRLGMVQQLGLVPASA